MEIVPTQNSPKHILVSLNDDCIQEVFRRVRNIRDFLSVATACKRFQENAKTCMAGQHFKKLIIGETNVNGSAFSIDQSHSVLRKFGHLIDSVIWCGYRFGDEQEFDDYDHLIDYEMDRRNEDQNVFDTIVECCSQRLEMLDISSVRFDYFYLDVDVNPFQNLQKIRLADINKYSADQAFDWLMRNFPKLVEVNFQRMDIEDADVTNFIKVNPQIKSLEICNCANITPAVHVAQRMPNVEFKFL